MEKILTVGEVAEILKVKQITVREMFREKRLRAFKIGKAWRTTETMLREDLDSLSRGEKPRELPDAAGKPPVRKKKTVEAAGKKPAKKAARKKSPEEKKPGEPQQFLF